MAQPHKGDRVPILVRVPNDLAYAVSRLMMVDRNAWIVAAMTEKLRRETNGG